MGFGIVNHAIASLMQKPMFKSELSDEALYGMIVEILEETEPEWYLVKTHYRYEGYVHQSALLFDDNQLELWKHTKKKVVIQAYADVLSMPKVQGYYLIGLTRGAVVGILEDADENGWVKVLLWDGQVGYMKQKFLGDYITGWSKEDETRLRKNIVNTALTYLCTQYRWGGKTPLGIDCSGLCSMAYLLNGIIIYRDAKIVEGYPVHEIPSKQIKPADLLFFPGHVAMYIGGNHYIHSTGKNGSDGVVINSLNPKDKDYREDLHKSLKAVGSVF